MPDPIPTPNPTPLLPPPARIPPPMAQAANMPDNTKIKKYFLHHFFFINKISNKR